MASVPTFTPNPYANFDPSQFTNPYSQFYGQALPWPSSYAGTPTNALGQPIQPPQPPQGLSLNSTPAQPQDPGGAPANRFANPQYQAGLAMMPSGNNFVASGSNPSGSNPQASNALAWMNSGLNSGLSGFGQMQQQDAPAPAAPAPPNNWQNTLSMLANPGHVTTPGATVPQAQSPTGVQPGVLQSFLANWKPQQSGPGSGFTQNFNALLRGLPATKGS